MNDRRPSLLLVTSRRSPFGFDLDELTAVTVLTVPEIGHAVRAMQSGFRPAMVIIDVGSRTLDREVWNFLRDQYESADRRETPVLLSASDSGFVYQVAPRDRQRKLPAPFDAGELLALVELLSAETWRPDAAV